jgi:hypothetical protein
LIHPLRDNRRQWHYIVSHEKPRNNSHAGGAAALVPVLHAEDLVNGWAYVRSRRMEIDYQIRDKQDAGWPAYATTSISTVRL